MAGEESQKDFIVVEHAQRVEQLQQDIETLNEQVAALQKKAKLVSIVARNQRYHLRIFCGFSVVAVPILMSFVIQHCMDAVQFPQIITEFFDGLTSLFLCVSMWVGVPFFVLSFLEMMSDIPTNEQFKLYQSEYKDEKWPENLFHNEEEENEEKEEDENREDDENLATEIAENSEEDDTSTLVWPPSSLMDVF